MLEIDETHLEKFEWIKNSFLSKTIMPEENKWKSLTSNEIWLKLFTQITVVGSSAPAKKFSNNPKLQNQVSYEKLMQIEDREELEKRINRVLRVIGTRYASSDISKCRKTNALAYNLKILSLEDGPKGLLNKLSELDLSGDIGKIKYLMKTLQYIQSKSARDFLMELGLVRNAIALDIRIQKILNEVGIELPKGFASNPKLYDEVEKDILLKICKPLGLLGVQLDRMLYQNYEEIMEKWRKKFSD